MGNTVWVQIPSSAPKKIEISFWVSQFFSIRTQTKGFEGGSRFAGAKRFALQDRIKKSLLAKAAIDNCRAGRAAKGANPFVMLVGVFFVGAKNIKDKKQTCYKVCLNKIGFAY